MTTQIRESVRGSMRERSTADLRSIVRRGDRRVWTELALEVAADVLRERERTEGPPPEGPAIAGLAPLCPRCGAATEPGHVMLRSSLLSFLFVGFSWSRLRFTGPAGDSTVLSQGQGRYADLCRGCGALTVHGDR